MNKYDLVPINYGFALGTRMLFSIQELADCKVCSPTCKDNDITLAIILRNIIIE